MDKNRIYTVKEIARLLGFSTNTVYKYLDEGKIKATRLGKEGRFRIPQKEVVKLLGLEGEKPQGVQKEESEPQLPKKLERPNLKPRSTMPAFLAIAAALFLLLVTNAVGNIKLYEAKSPKPSALGINTVVSTTKSPKPTPTPSVVPKAERVQPKKTLTISITDGGEFVNIRKEPAVNSEKIGQAHDGETFDLISIDVDWFGIKLPNGLTGFVSAEYVKGGTHE